VAKDADAGSPRRCPECNGNNLVREDDPGDTGTPLKPGWMACNDCAFQWGPVPRGLAFKSDLQTSYSFLCPQCGGQLLFERGTLPPARDAPVTVWHGLHMEHGQGGCDWGEVKWTNVPETEEPHFMPVPRST
jgi:hypothetical protein